MNPENISLVLDELAVRFGSTGAMLWEALVQYELAVAYTAVVMFVAFALLGLILRSTVFLSEEVDYDTKGAVAITYAIVFTVLCIVAFTHLPTIFAPEAAALRSLF